MSPTKLLNTPQTTRSKQPTFFGVKFFSNQCWKRTHNFFRILFVLGHTHVLFDQASLDDLLRTVHQFFPCLIHQRKRFPYTEFSWDVSKTFFALNFRVAQITFVLEVFEKKTQL